MENRNNEPQLDPLSVCMESAQLYVQLLEEKGVRISMVEHDTPNGHTWYQITEVDTRSVAVDSLHGIRTETEAVLNLLKPIRHSLTEWQLEVEAHSRYSTSNLFSIIRHLGFFPDEEAYLRTYRDFYRFPQTGESERGV